MNPLTTMFASAVVNEMLNTKEYQRGALRAIKLPYGKNGELKQLPNRLVTELLDGKTITVPCKGVNRKYRKSTFGEVVEVESEVE